MAIYNVFLMLMLLFISGGWVVDLSSLWIKLFFYVGTLVVISIYFMLAKIKVILCKVSFYRFLFLSLLLIVVFLFQHSLFEVSKFSILLKAIIAFLYATYFFNSGYNFKVYFVKTMVYLCYVSLFIYFLCLIFHGLVFKVPSFMLGGNENVMHRELYTFAFVQYYTTGDGIINFSRNQSVFWEAGVFAFFINIAFVLILFEKILLPRLSFVILFVALITTLSIGGYVGFLFMFFLYTIKNQTEFLNHSNRFILLSFISIVSIVVFYFFAFDIINSLAYHLLGRELDSDASAYIRFADMWLPYKVAFTSPLIGHPQMDAYTQIFDFYYERERDAITNSVGALFYSFGYIFAIFYLYMIYTSKVFTYRGFTFLILTFFLMHEPMAISIFVFLLIFNSESKVTTSDLQLF